jgi:hypothetical protein
MKTTRTLSGITKLFSVLILMSSLILGSCKKQAGPKGDTGPAGSPGNANVSSTTYTALSSAWTWDATNNYLYTNITVPGITADIYNTGAFLVYLQATTGEWCPLARKIVTSSTVRQSQRFA